MTINEKYHQQQPAIITIAFQNNGIGEKCSNPFKAAVVIQCRPPFIPFIHPWWLIQTTVISVYCLIIIILWQPYRTSLTVLVVWLIAKICKYIYLWCSWVENRLHYQHKSNEKLIRNKNEIQTNQNRSFPSPLSLSLPFLTLINL